jgi:hypothetical protein
MYVLIDDFRNFLNVDVIFRTAEAALEVLTPKVRIEKLLLDHDLGEGMDGYEFIKIALERGIKPKVVDIVSANPVGRDNIGFILEVNGYHMKSPHTYVKRYS